MADKGKVRVSVVIPTLNEEKNLVRLLPEVKEQLKGYSYEIIVVDGHSKDKRSRSRRGSARK